MQKVGEAQGGEFSGVIGPGQRGNLAVGRTQHHDIGGRLLEVDCLRRPVDHATCRGEEVHQPWRAAVIACWSMPFTPITTSLVARFSPLFQGLSK